MALGGDQGGSIRMPAAACGIVGLKPTYGLVPYTGIMSIEFTLDHAGPMARTVYDTALMLEVRTELFFETLRYIQEKLLTAFLAPASQPFFTIGGI